MKRNNGIHFYINIENLDDVIEHEEASTGEIRHSIHALDTFFSSVEGYGQRHYRNELVIEKITGSRLHMYVTSNDIVRCFEIVSAVTQYSQRLVYYMSQNISKYKTLVRFQIQSGACYGRFDEFTFKAEQGEVLTTIGFACNYAAKLQGLAPASHITISESIFDELPEYQRSMFRKKESKLIKKYEQSYYYDALISTLTTTFKFDKDLRRAAEIAQRVNLQDIQFRSATKPISFDNLSKTECKKIEGIPVFADIRDFTSQFDADDANLDDMANKTQDILMTMYQTVTERNGIHVQFQGDREMALFHDYNDYSCASDAVIAGMKMVDMVKEFQVSIGVGQACGRLFAAKIGARNSKDNILLGRTVIQADRNEDVFAEKNQVVISEDIYNRINAEKPALAKLFHSKADGLYFTENGYADFLRRAQETTLQQDNNERNYNGAWRANG